MVVYPYMYIYVYIYTYIERHLYIYICIYISIYRSRSATAIMTRWPGAGARVVPEGDALAITLGFNRSRRGCDHD